MCHQRHTLSNRITIQYNTFFDISSHDGNYYETVTVGPIDTHVIIDAGDR